MIGVQARGLAHAVRLSHGNPVNIIYFSEGNSHPREALLCTFGNEVYFFNDEIHNTRHLNNRGAEEMLLKTIHKQILCFEISRVSRNEYANYLKILYVLPSDFDKQYSDFLLANKKLFNNLANKAGFPTLDNTFSKFMYAITDGSKNFFQWAHICRSRGVSIVTICQILRWNDNYSQLAKNLKKGSITSYANFTDVFDLIDEQVALRKEKRVSNTVNMFNTAQKKLLKELPVSDEVYDVMSRFNRLSDVKKNNFIRKMSTVDNASEIVHQMSFLVDTHFKWEKSAFLDYVNNNEMVSVEIIYDKDDIVLVRVEDFDTIKRIAKNTSWCISKNKTYWNNYMSKSHISSGVRQYVLFDFSKKEDDVHSIVGFTLNVKKGITASHDFVNNNILDRRFSMNAYLRKRFNTLSPNKELCGGIHAILIDKGIDVTSLLNTGKIPYLWNSESFIKHLTTCLGGDDTFDVLSDENGRVAILVENEKIRKFLGDRYANNVPDDLWGNEHILFADFNESADSPNKLMYGIIEYNNETKEWGCNVVRNESSDPVPVSFDCLLDVFDLPYDIICRSDSKYDRVVNAFGSYDITTVKKFIGEEDVLKRLIKKTDSYTIFNSINYSMVNLVSDEYLKAIYENNVTLCDLLTNEQMCVLFDGLINMVVRRNTLPTDEDFKLLFKRDGSLDASTAESLAGCYMLNLIVGNEKSPEIFKILNDRIVRVRGLKNAFLKELITRINSNNQEQVSISSSKNGSVNVF